ncbi:hypothetical protein GUITHDRAFT_108133 [Guillardia theta CCMP2712]|uniref:Uncharacterized protein n=1 Tax=Guillardia theta (strain CCMP2712) TaxID=905079 RepID=L1JC22_GUITC|nr:hypothetical protein GUITHDRAFT_108133 [Guillardia theta CCMP2712]EKX46098.1 hypothetical protein GUITHDRAFT_108133 [Guillardia theta CCMP2712]|eukprot:XP_005833078.1 hypothetical protein GUITHDRAFT_108133 [Guillardia theta CCMP2712]
MTCLTELTYTAIASHTFVKSNAYLRTNRDRAKSYSLDHGKEDEQEQEQEKQEQEDEEEEDEEEIDKDTRTARQDQKISKSEEASAIKAAEKGEEGRALNHLKASQRYEDKAIRAQAQANMYGKDELKRSKEMEGQLNQGMNPNGGVAERERRDIRKEEKFVGKCLGGPFSLLSS